MSVTSLSPFARDLARKAVLAVAAVAAVGIMTAAFVQAQSNAGQKPRTFEVASVKPVAVPGGVTLMENGAILVRRSSGIQIPPNTGGPGTDNPGRIHWPLISLKQLLRQAWDSYYEIQSPGWLDVYAVAIDATMPPDTTKAQFQEMLRNLITERFGLKYRVEKKEITGYALVIARNGPKLKESANQGEVERARPEMIRDRDPYGFNKYAPAAGKFLTMSQMGDRSQILAQQMAIQALAGSLGHELKTIVTDATGLTAKYDFTLAYQSPEPVPPPANLAENAEPVTDIFTALQSQLGLRLERKPVPVEVFVVDHMERTPTQN